MLQKEATKQRIKTVYDVVAAREGLKKKIKMEFSIKIKLTFSIRDFYDWKRPKNASKHKIFFYYSKHPPKNCPLRGWVIV